MFQEVYEKIKCPIVPFSTAWMVMLKFRTNVFIGVMERIKMYIEFVVEKMVDGAVVPQRDLQVEEL